MGPILSYMVDEIGKEMPRRMEFKIMMNFSKSWFFWGGCLATILGVALHLPMFLMADGCGYMLAGMPMSGDMYIGMAAIVLGFISCAYGLIPDNNQSYSNTTIRVGTLDDAPITRAHIGLLIVMSLAIIIDVMKPTSLSFIMPYMATEYGLKSPLNPGGTIPVSYLALSGITGTVLGSFLWGWLADKIGRRGSIILAGIGFIGTSICGTMPDFWWNVIMCFLMGVAVGGLFPICYALLSEVIPARHRSWIMALIGANIVLGYIVTSWATAALVPIYSWRILWLIGFPTGILFVMLQRWIPESPRFLAAQGRTDEAEQVMAKYGAVIIKDTAPDGKVKDTSRWIDLFKPGLTGISLSITLLGLAAGFVLFGFNLWIPTNLRKLGFTEADTILRNAAIFGLPMSFIVTGLYGFWSSKKTIILLALVTALSLLGFALAGNSIIEHRWLLYVLLVTPITGISALSSVLGVYSSEIYPTNIRSRGAGLSAGIGKFGGILIIAMTTFAIVAPTILTISLFGAITLTIAVLLVAKYGTETRNRSLEAIDNTNKAI